MKSWLFPARRATEATAEQLAASGAVPGWGVDPVDGDRGYAPAGSAGRPVPAWTLEKARAHSVAAYRVNPMGRAVVDTYTSFCVGDRGVSYQVTNPQVRAVVDEFWTDPRNNLAGIQELELRTQLLNGETLLEMLAGPQSGRVRFSPIDSSRVQDVRVLQGNSLWPDRVVLRAAAGGDGRELQVAGIDDDTGLRAGEAQWWAPWKTLSTDRRSMPFFTPILDWLDSYDTVLSNMIDRTALARYLVWDVEVQGDQTQVDAFIAARGGKHVPPSGSVEVHNQDVTWSPKTAQTGAYEDVKANQSVLTMVAGGAGLAKTWLAEPENANRATSQSMAEPVRRRVQGAQKVWLACQTELVRFAVDRAVAAKRLPARVQATDPRTGQTYDIPASQSVQVTGPEIAAADSQITAQVLLNLSTGLEKLIATGALSREAAAVAARKGWEDYVGIPYTSDLDKPDANPGDVATHVDDQQGRNPLQAVK